jgi:hypothetical protein
VLVKGRLRKPHLFFYPCQYATSGGRPAYTANNKEGITTPKFFLLNSAETYSDTIFEGTPLCGNPKVQKPYWINPP